MRIRPSIRKESIGCLVNGKAVVADGKPTNALPGQVLRGPGYKPGTP